MVVAVKRPIFNSVADCCRAKGPQDYHSCNFVNIRNYSPHKLPMALYLSALDFLSNEFCDICNIFGILRVNFVWLIWYTGVPRVDTIRRYLNFLNIPVLQETSPGLNFDNGVPIVKKSIRPASIFRLKNP